MPPTPPSPPLPSPPSPPPRPPVAAGAWQLQLLGDVALRDASGRPMRLPGRPAAALLARLALAPQRSHPREELVELLWPGVGAEVGRNRLRQVLSTLRSVLEPPSAGAVIEADRQALRLVPGALACDVTAFEAAWRAGRHAEASAHYRGELMPGFFDEWIVDERLRLQALADRLGERPRAPAAAAGTGPAARPATAPAAMPAGAPAAGAMAPPAGSLASPPSFSPSSTPAASPAADAPAGPLPLPAAVVRLPHYLTRLLGAEAEVAGLCEALRGQRLVTLAGPGGQGKTRLAVAAARTLAEGGDFDLVVFVPLVACRDHESMLDTLLLALRPQAAGGEVLAQLGHLLAGRRALLLLDNFEQLVEAGAPVVAELLARLPQLHLLVTSRRLLGLDGEFERPLPPLPLPAAGCSPAVLAANPAVALFVERARAARADFHLGPRHRDAVAELVRLLQGMPLAIELAASRVRSLAPAALVPLLREARAAGSGEALQLLARSGPRAGSDPRHASMLAVVAWSWALLSPSARHLLPRLAVFDGGFTLAAAQAVCGEPAASIAVALDELVTHSMLRARPDEDRYELFELIREYAAAQADRADAAAMRARHRRWMIGWAQALPTAALLDGVRRELPNIAAAIAGAEADGAPADAAALAHALWGALSDISLPRGATAALQRCAERLADPVARALTRSFLARALFRAGDPAAARPLIAQALAELPPAGPQRALVLSRCAHLVWRLERDTRVGAWLDEALALAEAAGATAQCASIVAIQGAIARPRDPLRAAALQRRAIALWREAGDEHGVNTGRHNLALALAERRAGCAEALALLDDMGASALALQDWVQAALADNVRGEALSLLRRWTEAAAAYRACIARAWALPELLPLAYGLWNLPRALAHLRRPQAAARLLGFNQRFAPERFGPPSEADRFELRRIHRLCQAQLGAAAIGPLLAQGAALDLGEAVRLALEEG